MPATHRALFSGAGEPGTEFVEWDQAGARLRGTFTGWRDGPLAVAYVLEVDAEGRARRLDATLQAPGADRHLLVTTNGFGQWFAAGVPLPGLNGAVDVGLWLTPVPLFLALQRLALPFGAERRLPVCWVTGPALHLDVRHLRCAHLSADAAGHLFHVVAEDDFGQPAGPPEIVRLDPDGFPRQWGSYRRLGGP